MAKSNSNGNGADVTNGCAITPTIHLVLQGKGGVGKTVVAGWLAEFLIHRVNLCVASTVIRSIDHSPNTRLFRWISLISSTRTALSCVPATTRWLTAS